VTLPAKGAAYGQPAEKRRWQNRIFRQFFRNCRGGPIVPSIVTACSAGYARSVRREREGDNRALLLVLARLFLKIGVQDFDPARKSRSIVLRTGRLGTNRGFSASSAN